MRTLFAIVTACWLGACAVAPTRIEIKPPAQVQALKPNFTFLDARAPALPAQDSPAKPNGGDKQYLDSEFSVPPPELIQRQLLLNNDLLGGRTVKLIAFNASYRATPVRSGPMTSYNTFMYGALGALMSHMLDATKSPNHCSVGIDLEVDGQALYATGSNSISKYSGSNCLDEALQRALTHLGERVVDTLKPAEK